jgi:hypothetical protein
MRYSLFAILVLALLGFQSVIAQSAFQHVKVNWEAPKPVTKNGVQRLSFAEAMYPESFGNNAVYQIVAKAKPIAKSLINTVWEPVSPALLASVDTSSLKGSMQFKEFEKDSKYILQILMFRKQNGRIERLTAFDYKLDLPNESRLSTKATTQNNVFEPNSVLATGTWVKFNVQPGLNKLDYNFLVNRCGIPSGTDPRNIKVYGHNGYMLQELNSDFRPSDIPELAIFFEGETDGRLDQSDYALVYGTSTTRLVPYEENTKLYHQKNRYSDSTYYYVTFGTTPGKRIETVATAPTNPEITYTTFDDLIVKEDDQFNLLKSGRSWFGSIFDLTLDQTFAFTIPGLVPNSQVNIWAEVVTAGRQPNGGALSTWSLSANNNQLVSVNNQGGYYVTWLDIAQGSSLLGTTIATNSENVDINLQFNKKGYSPFRGYLDYIRLQVKRNLSLYNNQVVFRVLESSSKTVVAYNLGGIPDNLKVWDVTNFDQPMAMRTVGSSFTDSTNGQIKEYLGFTGSNFPVPSMASKVANQNLKGLPSSDLIIISNPSLLEQAERLATFRRSNDGLRVSVVTTEQIYTEFSTGKQDLTSIRDFVRQHYLKNNKELKYVLLFGAGSYDYKNRIRGNSNLVPIYQSDESFSPINSYCSDDYIAMLDSAEGLWRFGEIDKLDIGVGRLPAHNIQEAKQLVDKLVKYEDPITLGAWRTQMTFAADDGDQNLHANSAESAIAQIVDANTPFQIKKLFLGAFEQTVTPAGETSPAFQEELRRSLEEGCLTFNYSGHGNEDQLTDELSLDRSTIRSLRNMDNLPFFVTATCSFGRYDDPENVSGGEEVVLAPQGGGIGALVSNRLVFANNNDIINLAFSKESTRKVDGKYQRLGDVMRTTKNNSIILSSSGNRNYGLLADPSMKLAYPELNAVVTSINGSTNLADTFNAYEPILIAGKITDENNSLVSGFNGMAQITIFDKAGISTLFDNPVARRNFSVRNNILYKGTVLVTNGEWELRFVVPADIIYSYGRGLLSIYASDKTQNLDAFGKLDGFIVGGTYAFRGEDNDPPAMRLYMDDTTFRSGDFTAENTILLARLTDANGMNLSASGIGHEMVGILDGRSDKPFILNQYYLADPGTYQNGWIRYPIAGLSAGEHTLKVVAWDTYNNSVTQTIRFVVAEESNTALGNFSVFPNPSTSQANFVFSSNQSTNNCTVRISISDALGKPAATLEKFYESSPAVFGSNNELQFNFTNGDIGSGMYLYRVSLIQENGSTAVKTGKLIIR